MLLNYLIILYLLCPAVILGAAVLGWAGNPVGAEPWGRKEGNVTSGQGCCLPCWGQESSGLLRLLIKGVRVEKHQSGAESPGSRV